MGSEAGGVAQFFKADQLWRRLHRAADRSQ
jgi:hypothetical protein